MVRQAKPSYLLVLILVLSLVAVPVSGAEKIATSENSCPKRQKITAAAIGQPSYDECARFIAGVGNDAGPLAAYEQTAAWTRFSKSINQTWERFDRKHLAPMRQWASQELSTANTEAVFYPFSGPDFVNLYTLFPRARTYLLIALEPVGEVPDLAALDQSRFFQDLAGSLNDILQLNFFITDKLHCSLGRAEFKGVLPILLFFMAREQLQILDVRYWVMTPEGIIEESPATGPRSVGRDDLTGVRLDFTRPGSEERQTLYYFSVNLRNNYLPRNEKFIAFLKGFGPFSTFAKAASYLMHRPAYSGIRQFILDQSKFVLEGDSAIPLRYFERPNWNLKFFGTYTGPIAHFRCFQQRDLAAIYQKGAEVYPLPFGIDYRHRLNTSNLLFAAKKMTLAERALP